MGHYDHGEFYAAHYDAVDMSTEVGASFAQNGGNRLVTVLIYLNTVEDGGRTLFDKVIVDKKPLAVQPIKGMAVVFYPATMDAKIDYRYLHTALKPDGDQEKWVSQIWIREEATTYT